MHPIYLDNHASTPVDPRVFEAMLPYLREEYGNASSRSHAYGWAAERAVEEARGRIAALIGAEPREIVFTSGATESNNLALKGTAEAQKARGNHIISAATEHPSVLETLQWLGERGFSITILPVDRYGRITSGAVQAALTPKTTLISLMAANNEIGTVHPLAEIGRLAKERGVIFHSDATQGIGKIPFDVRREGVDLASLTGHKMNGPKGCGALYVRRDLKLVRQTHGGGQERGLRAGTLNVPGIVGLGMAAEICAREGVEESRRVAALRDRLRERLVAAFPAAVLNGDPEHRLPGNLHLSIPGLQSDALMLAMPEVACSMGAACASGAIEPSHVMKAIGVRPELARGSLRFGIGRFNTLEEIDRAAARVVECAEGMVG